MSKLRELNFKAFKLSREDGTVNQQRIKIVFERCSSIHILKLLLFHH